MIKQYTIHKGKHRTRDIDIIPMFGYKKWNVTAIFPEDCWHHASNGSIDGNRIFGVQFGRGYWSLNWSPAYERMGIIELYACLSDGKEVQHRFIGGVKVKKPCSVMVERLADKWWFSCADLGEFIGLPDRNIYTKVQFKKLPMIRSVISDADLTFFVEFIAIKPKQKKFH